VDAGLEVAGTGELSDDSNGELFDDSSGQIFDDASSKFFNDAPGKLFDGSSGKLVDDPYSSRGFVDSHLARREPHLPQREPLHISAK